MGFGSRFLLIWVLGAAVGCGRSIRHGEGEGAGGGSGGATGGTGAATAGAATAGQGGASGSGATTAGSGGISGAGGEPETARLFFVIADTLVSTDLEGGDRVELCALGDTSVQYALVGTDGQRLIFFRQHLLAPNDSDLVSVALDGSACETTFTGTLLGPLSPVVHGRVVLTVPPTPATAELAEPGTPERIIVERSGLASVRTDGTGFEVLAPSGVGSVRISSERVMFSPLSSERTELLSMRPDGSERTALVPLDGAVAFSSGRRLVVNVTPGDVIAVDEDGARLVELATGAAAEVAVGFTTDRVVIARETNDGSWPTDLFAVPLDGGELVPLATSAEHERYVGAGADRIVYSLGHADGTDDLVSVRLDGTDARPIAQTSAFEFFGAMAGDRVVFGRSSGDKPTPYFSAKLDGTDVRERCSTTPRGRPSSSESAPFSTSGGRTWMS